GLIRGEARTKSTDLERDLGEGKTQGAQRHRPDQRNQPLDMREPTPRAGVERLGHRVDHDANHPEETACHAAVPDGADRWPTAADGEQDGRADREPDQDSDESRPGTERLAVARIADEHEEHPDTRDDRHARAVVRPAWSRSADQKADEQGYRQGEDQ